MNKKNYILITLLIGWSVSAKAQQPAVVFQKQLSDTVSLGYQLNTNIKTSSYSISGVNEKAFENALAVDISKALYGKIAGLNVYQGVGSSEQNISSLSVHGQRPLVLVDGFPRDIEDLTSFEIKSCHLLKDAAAAALYGMRGANGVLIITTKRGENTKLKVNAQYHFGINSQFRAPRFADAFTYANAKNIALECDGLVPNDITKPDPRYNAQELEAFRTGTYPYEYPNVDWWGNTMNDIGFNHNLKLSFNGGSEKFRYYTVLDYYRDHSMLKKNTNDDRYDTSPTDTRLSLRTNLDVTLTPTTFMKLGLVGKLQEINSSRSSVNSVLSAVYNTPSASFPVRQANGIYGGNEVYGANNPVGLLKDRGHLRRVFGTLLADLSLRQDLEALTKGLSAEISVSFDNIGSMQESSSKEYRYMELKPKIEADGTLVTTPKIYGKDSQELGHSQPFESLMVRSDFQTKIGYARLFGNKHQVNGAIVYDMQSDIRDGRNTTTKNQSYILNASYAYDNRYVINGVFTYSGSSYLPDGDKFRSYPAVSAAWIISNESFLKDIPALNLLKVRASYGISGWDGSLTHELWRQSYGGGNGYYFGNATYSGGGSEGNLPVIGLTSERSEKVTAGIDLTVLSNRLSITLDGFYEKRSDVLVTGTTSTSGILGIGIGKMPDGIYKTKGFDASVNWNDRIGKVSYRIGANMSYLDSEVVNENQAYQEYDYLYRMGDRMGQMYGLEAIGFFESQMDINNSPLQTFSKVLPGDVKYKDQNGDNRIDEKDVVRMFGSSVPRCYFGFDLQVAYKGFEIVADFQGMTGVTTSLLNSELYMPLSNNGNISQTFLDREIYWTPDNKANATMPRLTTQLNSNNYRSSSLWFRDGSFLKLRNLMLAYTFSKAQTRLADIKVFVQGNNLFSLDNIKFADPEQLQMAYPSVRSYWAGVKLSF